MNERDDWGQDWARLCELLEMRFGEGAGRLAAAGDGLSGLPPPLWRSLAARASVRAFGDPPRHATNWR